MEFDATFLIAAVSFIIFVYIMNAVLYAPVMKIMKERDRLAEDNFRSAEALRAETAEKEKYHASELEAVRTEARGMLDAEMQRMNTEKSKIISEYKNELFKHNAEEKENLKKSALEAKEALKDSAADTAKIISSILLGGYADTDSINKSQVHFQIKEEDKP